MNVSRPLAAFFAREWRHCDKPAGKSPVVSPALASKLRWFWQTQSRIFAMVVSGSILLGAPAVPDFFVGGSWGGGIAAVKVVDGSSFVGGNAAGEVVVGKSFGGENGTVKMVTDSSFGY